MSQFTQIIIGGGEIIAGVALEIVAPGNPAGIYLIAAGAGQLIGGIGTLLNQPQGGLTTASRNPIAPWNVIYGRAKVGGTIVYIGEFGDDNKYLDLIFVLACHPCQSVDAVLFDNQRILFESNGKSKSPTQSNISISSIARSNGVVTVTLSSVITDLQAGDQIQIQDVSGQDANDRSLNGKFYIATVSGSTFTYLNGGLDVSLGATGSVQTVFADYANNVYFEALLGNHTETFTGMLDGTPITDTTVTNDNNPWTAQHQLLGRTSVFLRLHYTDVRFSNGLPQISFRVSGKNDISDPRTGSTSYTENSALCIADLLKQPVWGFKASSDEVPDADLISAANICDEDVTLASGGTEPRYTCNGNFPLSMKPGEILQNMLTSCGGRVTYAGGAFVIHPAAWPGVSLGVGRVITSATISVVTTHIPGTGYIGTGEASLDDPNNLFSGGGDFLFDSSAWTKRTDTATFDNVPASAVVNFAIAGSLLGDAAPADELRIFDCWMDAVFADGSTATLRPTVAKAFASGAGSISDAANVIDGDPDSYATITRSHFSSLSNSPVIQVSNFILADASPISPIGGAQIAGSLEGLSIMAGPFRWKSKLSIRDLYNGVKGTYVSPANGWQPSDFPPYAQDTLHGYGGDVSPSLPEGDANLAADGGDRRWLDWQLPFTISPSMAQRLAKIELLRRRQQGTGTFAFNMSLYWATALDVVAFTLPYLGWSGKLLEIESHRLTFTKQQGIGGNDVTALGCELDVQETDPALYDWSATEELSPQGFQQSVLPDTSNPKPPTNITLESDASTSIVGSDGIARSRILVSWTAPADGYVLQGGHVEIQYRNTSSPADAWVSLGNIDPSITSAYVEGVVDGQTYDVQIRSVNAAGVPSDWVDAGNITVSGQSSQISPNIITQDGATSGQGLVWNGSEWAPTDLGSILLQTDGTDNGSQTKLNLKAGTDITLTDDGVGGITIASSSGASQPYDVLCAFIGKPGAGATVLIVTFDRSVTFAGNFSGSFGTVGTNPTSSATFAVNKNGSSIGTVAVSTGGSVTFTTTSGASQSFSAGDRMTVIAPGSQDATLADFAFIFAGTR